MAGDPADPDLVAFTGFEWTQVGRTPETHFGHKCVFFRDDAESALPARPITAQSDDGADLFAGLDQAKSLRFFDPPRLSPGEDMNHLIEDPWLRFDCGADPSGCTVQFEDLEFPQLGRHTLYYARVIEEETPAINGANLRTQFDSSGKAVATKPCYGDYRTPFSDDCLAPVQERPWSSPIFVDPGGAQPLTDRSGP